MKLLKKIVDWESAFESIKQSTFMDITKYNHRLETESDVSNFNL